MENDYSRLSLISPGVVLFVALGQSKFQDRFPDLKLEQWRSKVGAFGVTGDAQLNPIANLRCVPKGFCNGLCRRRLPNTLTRG